MWIPAELVGKGFGWWPAPAGPHYLLTSNAWIKAQHSEPGTSVKNSAFKKKKRPPELRGYGENLEHGNSWAERGREMPSSHHPALAWLFPSIPAWELVPWCLGLDLWF